MPNNVAGSQKIMFKISFKEEKNQGEMSVRRWNRKTQTLLPNKETLTQKQIPDQFLLFKFIFIVQSITDIPFVFPINPLHLAPVPHPGLHQGLCI